MDNIENPIPVPLAPTSNTTSFSHKKLLVTVLLVFLMVGIVLVGYFLFMQDNESKIYTLQQNKNNYSGTPIHNVSLTPQQNQISWTPYTNTVLHFSFKTPTDIFPNYSMYGEGIDTQHVEIKFADKALIRVTDKNGNDISSPQFFSKLGLDVIAEVYKGTLEQYIAVKQVNVVNTQKQVITLNNTQGYRIIQTPTIQEEKLPIVTDTYYLQKNNIVYSFSFQATDANFLQLKKPIIDQILATLTFLKDVNTTDINNWHTYTKDGFSIQEPNLELNENGGGSPNRFPVINFIPVVIFSTASKSTSFITNYISLLITGNQTTQSLQEYISQAQQSMNTKLKSNGITTLPVYTQQNVQYGGKSGIKLISDSGYYDEVVYIPYTKSIDDNRILILSVSDSDKGDFTKVFEKMLSTLKFEN